MPGFFPGLTNFMNNAIFSLQNCIFGPPGPEMGAGWGHLTTGSALGLARPVEFAPICRISGFAPGRAVARTGDRLNADAHP